MLVHIPEEIYSRLQTIALATEQPLEQVIANRLESSFIEPIPALPPDEQAELDALRHLSDDTLWTIAAEQMPDSVQAHMQALMDKNSLGQLSENEYQELEHLVERGNRLMLRKAEASVILIERGHTFTQVNFSQKHE